MNMQWIRQLNKQDLLWNHLFNSSFSEENLCMNIVSTDDRVNKYSSTDKTEY